MVWSHWICDTITGQKQLLVSPASGSWERKLNGVGQGSHTFVVQGHPFGRDRWRDLLDTKWNRVLVVCWEEVPVYAGIITSADPAADGTVSVNHYEVRSVLDRRFPFTVASYPSGTAIINGRSLRGIVYQALTLAINGSPRRSLPLAFPAFDESGPFDKTLWNYEFQTIETAINEVQNGDDGPDIDFQPRWAFDGTLQWLVRVGSPALTGPTFEFNPTASQTDVIAISGRTEATNLVTTVHMIGKGEEQDMRRGGAEIGGVTPALEVARNLKEIDDVDVLNAHALAEAQAFSAPVVQPSVTLPASRVLPGILPGSSVRLLFEEHWWYLDVPMEMRCVAFNGDGSESVSLTVQEVPG